MNSTFQIIVTAVTGAATGAITGVRAALGTLTTAARTAAHGFRFLQSTIFGVIGIATTIIGVVTMVTEWCAKFSAATGEQAAKALEAQRRNAALVDTLKRLRDIQIELANSKAADTSPITDLTKAYQDAVAAAQKLYTQQKTLAAAQLELDIARNPKDEKKLRAANAKANAAADQAFAGKQSSLATDFQTKLAETAAKSLKAIAEQSARLTREATAQRASAFSGSLKTLSADGLVSKAAYQAGVEKNPSLMNGYSLAEVRKLQAENENMRNRWRREDPAIAPRQQFAAALSKATGGDLDSARLTSTSKEGLQKMLGDVGDLVAQYQKYTPDEKNDLLVADAKHFNEQLAALQKVIASEIGLRDALAKAAAEEKSFALAKTAAEKTAADSLSDAQHNATLAATQGATAALEKKDKSTTKTAAAKTDTGRDPATDALTRIGLFTGPAANATNYARRTAENSERQTRLLSQIAATLATPAPAEPSKFA